MRTLGLVAAGPRNIRSGSRYDYLFPDASGKNEILEKDGSVKSTVRHMDAIVSRTLEDTKKLAPVLRGKSLRETCQNIWSFLYNHIQYKLDSPGKEQLRRPSRAWKDRVSGIDCDCFSIFASSILTNLGIHHRIKVTDYGSGWQHVYVVVPKVGNGYYTIDPVVDQFDYEKPYTDKFYHTMSRNTLSGIPIEFLSGVDFESSVGSVGQLNHIISGADFNYLDALEGLGADTEQAHLDAIYKHLVNTRNFIAANPHSVFTTGGAKTNLEMLDYALRFWHNPVLRDKALDVLEEQEERWNRAGGLVAGFDDDDLNGLGKTKAKKKFFSSIKDAVKKVTTKVTTTVKNTVNKVTSAVKDVAKKAIKAVVKYNPLTLAARGGFLIAMKVNLFHMASRLYPALISQSEAEKLKISPDRVETAKKSWDKISKMWEKIGGNTDKLKEAILKGRAKKRLSGLGALGAEPATSTTAIIAASAPIISALAAFRAAGNRGVKGLGNTVGETEETLDQESKEAMAMAEEAGAEVEKDPAAADQESSGPVKKLLTAIRKWFSSKKNQQAAEEVAPEVQKTLDQEKYDDTESESSGSGSSVKKVASADSGSDDSDEDSEEEGFIAKAIRFAKENPGKTLLGAAAVGAVVTLAVSPKARKAVGLGGVSSKKRKRRKSKKSLSGTKTSKRTSGSKKPRRIELK